MGIWGQWRGLSDAGTARPGPKPVKQAGSSRTKKSAFPGQPWNTHLAKLVTTRVSQSQGPWEVSSQGLGAGARH